MLHRLSKIGLTAAIIAAVIIICFISFLPPSYEYPSWSWLADIILGAALVSIIVLPVIALIMWIVQRFTFESLNIYTILVGVLMLIYLFIQMAKVGC